MRACVGAGWRRWRGLAPLPSAPRLDRRSPRPRVARRLLSITVPPCLRAGLPGRFVAQAGGRESGCFGKGGMGAVKPYRSSSIQGIPQSFRWCAREAPHARDPGVGAITSLLPRPGPVRSSSWRVMAGRDRPYVPAGRWPAASPAGRGLGILTASWWPSRRRCWRCWTGWRGRPSPGARRAGVPPGALAAVARNASLARAGARTARLTRR